MAGPTPYSKLPRRAYWRTSVQRAAQAQSLVADLWQPKFPITPQDRILTTGSCFAQHIGRALAAAGYGWHDAEPAPYGISADLATAYHYGVFSFRVGNIYTPDVLIQWLRWAQDPTIQDREVWQDDTGYFDPLRPQIEPDGFASEAELFAARAATFAAIRDGVKQAQVFIFTLGLTEGWVNTTSGLAYSSCPGTIAGHFDETQHAFLNLDYPAIVDGVTRIRDLLHALNPAIRILLTVSPVPLAATATPGAHVLTATVQSKSVLRAAAGTFAAAHPDVDYFPSYELVTHPALGRDMFADDRRNVPPDAVAFVMQHVFAGLGITPADSPPAPHPTAVDRAVAAAQAANDVICEEAALEDFNADSD